MNRKGLSQILYLIIAASVLMMAALSLVFAFQSGVAGTDSDAQVQACQSAVETKCRVADDSDIQAPSTCNSLSSDQEALLPAAPGSDNEISCSDYGY